MCTLFEEPPTEKVWKDRGLEKYGVIAVSSGEKGDAAQVEKVDHPTAVRMLKNLGDIGQVGPSLGSFSVSAKILAALIEEFKDELAAKDGKLDTGELIYRACILCYLLLLKCQFTYLPSVTMAQTHISGCQ